MTTSTKHTRDNFAFIIKWIAEYIDSIEDAKEASRLGKLNLGIIFKGGKVQANPLPMSDAEKVTLSISPKDAGGATVTGGTYIWASSNPVAVTLVVAPDGLSADAISGLPGVSTISVTDGTLTDTIDITITAGIPSALNLSAGNPIPE